MNSEKRATLRLHLKEELLAYELETVIDVINETYTSLRWLELAEAHRAADPYGDSTFAFGELLRIKRVEIGTPNFLELYGLHDTLVQTLTYLASIGGVVGIVKGLNLSLDAVNKGVEIRKNWIEGRLKKLELEQKADPKRQQLEKMKLEEDVVKSQLGNEKLRLELEQAKKKKIEPILEKTKRLNRNGKASASVLAYKTKRQEAIAEKLSYPTMDDAVEEWELVPD